MFISLAFAILTALGLVLALALAVALVLLLSLGFWSMVMLLLVGTERPLSLVNGYIFVVLRGIILLAVSPLMWLVRVAQDKADDNERKTRKWWVASAVAKAIEVRASSPLSKGGMLDPLTIAKREGIVTVVGSDIPEGFRGWIKRVDSGDVSAYISERYSRESQRFTGGQLLGYLYLDSMQRNIKGEDESFMIIWADHQKADGKADWYARKWADEFAATLLMPEASIQAALMDDSETVKDLSKKFGVTVHTMAVRLRGLGYNV